MNEKQELRAELDETRAEFHRLLESLSDEDWQRQSLNPGWTNGEILFHMTLAFLLIPSLAPLIWIFSRLPRGFSRAFAGVLTAGTGLFNWANGLGPRGGARAFDRQRLGRLFDRNHARILHILESASEADWARGMHYPTRWDPNFGDFMTLRDLLHYPTAHFRFHLQQIAK